MERRNYDKDYYVIIGVHPNASQKEIREAYYERTRVCHPDRFNQVNQKTEWEKANEMQSEINEAYRIIGDPSERSAYDQWRKSVTDPTSPHIQPSSASFDSIIPNGLFKQGHINYTDLPEDVRSRLRNRQNNKEYEQVILSQNVILINFLFFLILPGWFLLLYLSASTEIWDLDTLRNNTIFSVVIALLMSWYILIIINWFYSTLKSNFYLTPMYFIKTRYNHIEYWAIWKLDDIKVTHHYINGAYHKTVVKLTLFLSHIETITFTSIHTYEVFMMKYNTYISKLTYEMNQGNLSYLADIDDFADIQSQHAKKRMPLTQRANALIYIIVVFVLLLSSIGLSVTGQYLHKMNVKKEKVNAVNRVDNDPIRLQHINTYWATKQIDRKDALRVRAYIKAYYGFDPDPESIDKLTEDILPRATPIIIKYPEVKLPFTGTVKKYTNERCIAPFTIKTDQGTNFLLKLVSANSNSTILTVFIKNNTTVKIYVPIGEYVIRYASGNTWYGYEHLFGPKTSYYKADENIRFYRSGNKIIGYSITLYKVDDGKLQTSSISASEF